MTAVSPETMAMLLMFDVPGGMQLSDAQNHGHACVWCGLYLPAGTGTELGGVAPWRPTACPPCLVARARWFEVYQTWCAHQETCANCIGMQRCEYATGYRRMFRFAHAATGRAPLRCAVCRWDIIGDDAFAPFRAEGLSAPVMFLFAHVPQCPSRKRHQYHAPRPRRGTGH
ncbi:hypothetical protein ACIQU5_32170 [Streptomyces sp. NPDC090306]|uniref:hypothetical protein n=1 Tax=Streptomyces sp. NPDC090306 TaxID=3365961 RepID=UPI0037F38F8A